MAGVNLNEIYQAIGSLTSAVQSLAEKIEANERRNAQSIAKVDDSLKDAAKSRADVHKRLDDLVIRTTHLEDEVHSVKEKTTAMQEVTDDVVSMRQRVQGAGWFGRISFRVAVAFVTFGGWLAWAYTALTGRPPP